MSNGKVATIAVSLILVVAISGYGTIDYFQNQPTSITCRESTSTFIVMQNETSIGIEFPIPAQPCIHEISLHGFTLTARVTSGDLHGTITVNSRSQLEGLIVYVNGAYEIYAAMVGPKTREYSILYNATFSNDSPLITSGTNYLVKFVAIFKDGTASTASVVVRAS